MGRPCLPSAVTGLGSLCVCCWWKLKWSGIVVNPKAVAKTFLLLHFMRAVFFVCWKTGVFICFIIWVTALRCITWLALCLADGFFSVAGSAELSDLPLASYTHIHAHTHSVTQTRVKGLSSGCLLSLLLLGSLKWKLGWAQLCEVNYFML